MPNRLSLVLALAVVGHLGRSPSGFPNDRASKYVSQTGRHLHTAWASLGLPDPFTKGNMANQKRMPDRLPELHGPAGMPLGGERRAETIASWEAVEEATALNKSQVLPSNNWKSQHMTDKMLWQMGSSAEPWEIRDFQLSCEDVASI